MGVTVAPAEKAERAVEAAEAIVSLVGGVGTKFVRTRITMHITAIANAVRAEERECLVSRMVRMPFA